MPSLTWSHWSPRERPLRALLAVVILVLAVGAVVQVDRFLAVVGAVAMLTATSEGLLPIRYDLGDHEVQMSTWLTRRRQPWSHFQDWRQMPDGFWLLSDTPSGLLRRRRALFLRSPTSPRLVEELLRARLGESGGRHE